LKQQFVDFVYLQKKGRAEAYPNPPEISLCTSSKHMTSLLKTVKIVFGKNGGYSNTLTKGSKYGTR
jgi:hypothetical protein